MKKQINIENGKVHAIFECKDCGEYWGDFNSALKKAYQHAKKTGHRVEGETGYFFHYN